MKRVLLSLPLLCATLFAAAQGERFSNNEDPLQTELRKLVNASIAISNLYVDSVDNRKMVEDAINGILSKLDPHSAYTNASETKRLTEPTIINGSKPSRAEW